MTVKNVTEDAAAKDELTAKSGSDQAPCLVAGDACIQESADIVKRWADAFAPV